MSTKAAFKQKMETEVSRAQIELAEFRTRGTAFSAESKKLHDQHVVELERKLDVTRTKLKELDDSEEDVWEELKDGVESTWGTLQSGLQKAIVNFKTEIHK
jgi:predicted  nucleic acid-binding Zn-ribbon protein